MGPLLFRAEDDAEAVPRVWLRWAASMGPLLFRAEDTEGGEVMPVQPCELQWGRSCSERKTRTDDDCPPTSRPCFNGAALVQSGRHETTEATRTAAESASMGPLLFRAEDGGRSGEAGD